MAIATGPSTGGNLTFLALMIALTLLAAAVAVLHPSPGRRRRSGSPSAAPAVLGVGVGLAAIPLGAPVDRGEPGAATALGLGGVVLAGSPLPGRRRVRRVLARRPARLRAARPAAGARRPGGAPRAARPGPGRAGSGPGWLGACRSPGRPSACSAIPLAVYVELVPALGGPGATSIVAGLARPRQHRPDARGPHAVDVRLPQQPAGDARRIVAVVGLAAGPQAGLVLPGVLRRVDIRRDLRRRQPGDLVAVHPGLRLRRLAGLPAAQPGARPRRDHVRRHCGCPGRGSTARPSSTTTTRRCPFVLLALAYFVAELWHGPSAPDVAPGPRGRRRSRAPRPGRSCGSSAGPLCCSSESSGRTRARRPARRRRRCGPADQPAGRRPRRGPRARRRASSSGSSLRLRPGDPAGRRVRGARPRRSPGSSGALVGLGDRRRGRRASCCPATPLVAPASIPGELARPRPGSCRSAPLAWLVLARPVAAPVRGGRRPRGRPRLRRSSTRTGRACRSRTPSSTGTRACCRPGSTRSSSRSTRTRR